MSPRYGIRASDVRRVLEIDAADQAQRAGRMTEGVASLCLPAEESSASDTPSPELIEQMTLLISRQAEAIQLLTDHVRAQALVLAAFIGRHCDEFDREAMSTAASSPLNAASGDAEGTNIIHALLRDPEKVAKGFLPQ